MYREMYKQILEEHRKVSEKIQEESLETFTKAIRAHERIFLIGVGREGMATKAFAMRLMHMGKEIHWIWDDTTPNIEKGDLVIATLGDGQIGHIDYVCRRAKEAGGFIYVITGDRGGKTVRQVADEVFFLPATVYRGNDAVVPSAQPMGNLFEQCLFITFDIIIMKMVEETGDITFETMSKRHRNVE